MSIIKLFLSGTFALVAVSLMEILGRGPGAQYPHKISKKSVPSNGMNNDMINEFKARHLPARDTGDDANAAVSTGE